ncbi:S-formylglutathione hydrolase-like [Sycon ciliatum]|uniref:S-formylglutathione hydrolase-like n=1 Tax=Sycon ciliatum TaxID=27933 RepID=UPI0031F64CA5
MAGTLTEASSTKIFGGYQKVFKHESHHTDCTMTFAVYLPPQAEEDGAKLPVLYYLSGLTCTEQNVVTKSGFQRYAAEHGLIVVCPDTSPRGCGIEGEDDSWDFGTGAGFYVDATEEKWKKNYNMYSYVTEELPALVNSNFPVNMERTGITGHSMGGHGAIVCALKNPGLYQSVSAFSPICNPCDCPWGEKCFGNYLGSDKEAWKAYDACELLQEYNGPPLTLLVDQGKADNFLEGQLKPDNLVAAARKAGMPLIMRLQEGYDHSYYFIASFIGDHFHHHAKVLNEPA